MRDALHFSRYVGDAVTLRRYGYGTPLLVRTFGDKLRRVTAIGAGVEDGQPVCDCVDQQGNRCWVWDSQIVKVLE